MRKVTITIPGAGQQFLQIEKTKKDLKLESVDEDINLNSFIDKLYSISDNEILIESFKDNYKKDRKNLKNFKMIVTIQNQ